MKKISILLGLMMICGICFPQNTGYLGRHFILNAEGSLSPSWLNPNPLTTHLNEHFESKHTQRYLGLNYVLSPNIEAIVWEKGTVGVGYDFYHSPYKGFTISKEFHYLSGGNITEKYDNSGMITAHGFNVYYKQYLGNTKAPMGWYAKFTFDGFFYNYRVTDTIPQWMSYYDLVDTVTNPTSGHNSIFGLKAEIGYDYVFFNFLKVSMGLSLGTTFGGYKVTNTRAHNKFNFDDTNESALTIENRVRNRMLNAYWFGIKLGIGFITF